MHYFCSEKTKVVVGGGPRAGVVVVNLSLSSLSLSLKPAEIGSLADKRGWKKKKKRGTRIIQEMQLAFISLVLARCTIAGFDRARFDKFRENYAYQTLAIGLAAPDARDLWSLSSTRSSTSFSPLRNFRRLLYFCSL